jgi:hypothetical protein
LPIEVKEALAAKVMREQKDRMEGIAKKDIKATVE